MKVLFIYVMESVGWDWFCVGVLCKFEYDDDVYTGVSRLVR